MLAWLFLFFATAPFESTIAPWGADCEFIVKENSTKPGISEPNKAIKGCLTLIRFYQNHISPIDGPRSHFYPSSSQYTLLAIEKYGVFKGIAIGCDRLMRENKAQWIYPYKDNLKLDPVR